MINGGMPPNRGSKLKFYNLRQQSQYNLENILKEMLTFILIDSNAIC